MTDVHVKGLRELNEFLTALPAKVERNILSGALRKGANVIKAQALGNVPVKSGELRRSLKVGVQTRRGVVTATVKTKVFYARFVEFGTASHMIRAKGAGMMMFGGIFAKVVNHPGTRPKAFLRPALDSQAQNAVIAAAEYMKKRLETKHGLDTADISIEGIGE